MGSPVEIDYFYNSKAGQPLPLPCPEIKKTKKNKQTIHYSDYGSAN
jgi:hypothetical protein